MQNVYNYDTSRKQLTIPSVQRNVTLSFDSHYKLLKDISHKRYHGRYHREEGHILPTESGTSAGQGEGKLQE